MLNLNGIYRTVYPSSVYGYFDKIQLWVRSPATKAEQSELRKQCGKGGCHFLNLRARFDSRYRQRIQLRQSSPRALQWVGARGDALINGTEIALDFVYDNAACRDDAFDFLHRHVVRRWHPKHQPIHLYRNELDASVTRYDGPRAAPNLLGAYPETHSRVTGELNVVHLEWRANGARAVRRVGVEEPRDVLGLDFRAFWRKRLRLMDIADEERLGRIVRNAKNGTRDRKPRKVCKGRNEDLRLGRRLSAVHPTIQELIDNTRPARIGGALKELDNSPFLPP